MARDYLTQSQKDALGRATRRTTLFITLGDGTPLYFSTADTNVAGVAYLGKLAPIDALNLELTAAVEGIALKISNITLALGQNLINTPDLLSGTTAVLGVYFYDAGTGLEWTDEKITGEIAVGDIDDNWVNVFFASKVDAVEYGGVSIAALFPDSAIPASALPAPPAPVFNDIDNRLRGGGGGGLISPFGDDFQNTDRYVLPEFQRGSY